ncbi:MAG: uroporphyrinogen decarboxylase family protein [Candidatus Thorarchaeota archaeon]
MDSRERVMITFDHEEPDRVPILEPWIETEVCTWFGGDGYHIRAVLDHDCFPLYHHPKGKTQAYGHGIDEWGRIFKHGQYEDGLIKSESDLEQFTPPLTHAEDWFPEDHVRTIKNRFQEKYPLYFAWHDCSLGMAYLSMGIERFFRGLYTTPELVKEIIERNTEWTIALVEQANANDVDFIVLGDDAAGKDRPLISPKMFRKLILPEYKKIMQASDVPIIWHSDGYVVDLLPMIIEAGFAGVHSLEPQALVDLKVVKQRFGDKLVLCGNVDTTGVLCGSDPSHIHREVERCIRDGAPGGGYLFSSSNSLFEGHDYDAIIETYKHARAVGLYPISL